VEIIERDIALNKKKYICRLNKQKMKRNLLIAATALLGLTLNAQFKPNQVGIMEGSSYQFTDKVDMDLAPASIAQGCVNFQIYIYPGTQPYPFGGFVFGPAILTDTSGTPEFYLTEVAHMFNANGDIQGLGVFHGFKALIDSSSSGGTYVANIWKETTPGTYIIVGTSIPVPYASIDTSVTSTTGTIFPFMPAVAVTGNFLVSWETFSSDTSSGAAAFANGPTCGTSNTFVIREKNGAKQLIPVSNFSFQGAPLKADPKMGIRVLNYTGGVDFISSSDLMAFPNPASKSTVITFGAEANSQGLIEIMNLSGQRVAVMNAEVVQGKNQIEVSLSGLANGIYVYHVTAGAQKMSSKLVVNH
jgi:hypothetical protein